MKVGVLALQGDFAEHVKAIRRLGAEAVEVRLPEDLDGLDGLIIPGGESTTMGKLAVTFGLLDPLREKGRDMPMWGTCGGLVLMAKDVGQKQPILGLLDIRVERNAFGRQVDSFEQDLDVEGIEGGPVHGVFIRAPVVLEAGPGVKVISRLSDGRIVGVIQGRHMATSFHPELTDDNRMHELFLNMIEAESSTDRG